MKKTGTDIWKLLRSSWSMLLLFEILYRVFSRFVVYPATRGLFNGCLKLSGLRYVGVDNLFRFLTNPLMLLASLIVFLFFTLTTVIEISCVLTCLHSARRGEHYGILHIIVEGSRDAVRLLRVRNWPLLIITAALIPVIQLPSGTSMIRLINLPWSSLRGYAMQMPWCLLVAAYLAAVALSVFLIPTVYAYYVIEDLSCSESLRRSYDAGAGRRVRNALCIFVYAAGGCLIAFGATRLLSRGIKGVIGRLIPNVNLQYRVTLPFDVLFSFVESALPVVSVLLAIAVIYYAGVVRQGLPLASQAHLNRLDGTRANRVLFAVTLIVVCAAVLLYDSTLRPALARYDMYNLLDTQQTLVIAHRGCIIDPQVDENTLAAFHAAGEIGVDYIELDVQQTSDDVVIVNHDTTFYRVFRDRRKVWQTSFADTRQLRSVRGGECPPTLEEVLTQCDPNLNFIVELKDNGHNPGLAKAVYDVIDGLGCLDRCIIQSSSYNMLRAFKHVSPDTRCGYIMSFGLGAYASLDAVDFFSIDMTFVNTTTLNSVHRLNKPLFAWTVNREKDIDRMVALGVDGLITDDAPAVKNMLLTQWSSPLSELISAPIEEALDAAEEAIEDATGEADADAAA